MPTSAKNKSEVQVSDTKHTRSVIRSLSPSGSVRTDLLGSWCLFHPCVFVLLTMWPAVTAPMCRSERRSCRRAAPGVDASFHALCPKSQRRENVFAPKWAAQTSHHAHCDTFCTSDFTSLMRSRFWIGPDKQSASQLNPGYFGRSEPFKWLA